MVAIPERGQVSMEVAGTTYMMQLSPHALAVLKKETGLSLKGVIESMQAAGDDPDFELVMTLLWAAMQDHHPELSKEDAMRFFPAGGLEELIEKMNELFEAAFPSQVAVAEENPPKAATRK